MRRIEGIIDRFEGGKAVIRANGEEFSIPKKLIPEAKEGDVMKFSFVIEKTKTKNIKSKAKRLISEILKGK